MKFRDIVVDWNALSRDFTLKFKMRQPRQSGSLSQGQSVFGEQRQRDLKPNLCFREVCWLQLSRFAAAPALADENFIIHKKSK